MSASSTPPQLCAFDTQLRVTHPLLELSLGSLEKQALTASPLHFERPQWLKRCSVMAYCFQNVETTLSVAMDTDVFPIQSCAYMSDQCSRRNLGHAADWTKGTRHELAMNVPVVISSPLVLHTASPLLTLAP